MNRLLLATLVLLSAATAALSAEESVSTSSSSGGRSIKDMLADGYEIKAAAPSGAKTILFLQKDTSAYACEFVTVAKSRCGQIN